MLTRFNTLVFGLFLWVSITQHLNASDIILQGFHWESYSYSEGGKPHGWYRILTSQINDFKRLGVKNIWLPPPSACFAGDARDPHSRGYLPTEYYQLNTWYGSEEDLRHLIRELDNAEIRPIADIVINHRHATGWSKTNGKDCQNLFYNPDWGPEVITKNDGKGCGTSPNYDTGQDNAIFLDLDHLSPKVQNDIISWLKWLRWDVGFRGWRYDQVHGFGGQFVGLYNRESSPEFSFGEIWEGLDYGCSEGLCYNQDRHRQSTINWIDSTWRNVASSSEAAAGAFDFTTRGILKEAVQKHEFWRLKDAQGRSPGVMGLWPSKALTFIDNHDTGSTQRYWPFSDDPAQIIQGYAFILTHPGTPTVFYDHLYYWGKNVRAELEKLMQLRVKYNIRIDSPLRIERAEFDLYAAYIGENVVLKLGPALWEPPGVNEQWKLETYGQDYAVWVRK